MKKILFLGYDRTKTVLIEQLIKENCQIEHTSGDFEYRKYDLVICFGYNKIITSEAISRLNCPIINLHISLLPHNKGAHPNFWSFYDNTESGVTIHELDDGIDTGPIIFQRKIKFDIKTMTFKETYNILINEIQKLFIEHIQEIVSLNWISYPQEKIGKKYRKCDLPKAFKGWNTIIFDEIKRLKELDNRYP